MTKCERCYKREVEVILKDLDDGKPVPLWYTFRMCKECASFKLGTSNPTIEIYDLKGNVIGNNWVKD